MEYSPALVEGLSWLSDALDDPITDLQAVLSVLTDDLTIAIPEFLGLTVTLNVEDEAVIITTLDADSPVEIRASLLLPLLPFGATTTTGSVAFFSGTPRVFVDLADDARWIFDLDGPPVVDSHLTPTRDGPAGIRGLSALSELNQAVGVLVEEGHTQLDARAELRRRASRGGHSMSDAARDLLSTLPRPDQASDDRPVK